MSNINYDDHSDSVDEQLKALARAYKSGQYELGMSLAESVKAALIFQGQERRAAPEQHVGASVQHAVGDLPAAWARWANGWSFFKPITLYEEVGLARSREPVELAVSFAADHVSDLQREIRLARVDGEDGTIREVPSQVHSEMSRQGERLAKVVLLADAPMHGPVTYLLFYGNRYAELPDYASDLQVTGEGYGIDISNRHYSASLSRQMGQLERLRLKREHGLELYAGGKGHGEPPLIDWAHDYVDDGGFQKMRVKNWAECPNYEIVKGPLCVKVRRWGFPHSPLHPIYTQSRLHMDLTYVFYAGLPYFIKETRMDTIKDMNIGTLRDDEWVFSGYSFTDQLWIDRHGKVHEGPVSTQDREELWGVGFFHEKSHDSFVAIWLDHSARNAPKKLVHNGAPALHYFGHGQLYSRAPIGGVRLKAGTTFSQRNAYVLSPYDGQNSARELENLRHRLLHPLETSTEGFQSPPESKAIGALARPGEAASSAPLKDAVWETLREVKDEQFYQIDANVVDLGLIRDVRVRGGDVHVLMTMPHRGRPVYEFFVTRGGGRVEEGIQERVERIPGVENVVVDFTWDPAWTSARLTKKGRQTLGLKA